MPKSFKLTFKLGYNLDPHYPLTPTQTLHYRAPCDLNVPLHVRSSPRYPRFFLLLPSGPCCFPPLHQYISHLLLERSTIPVSTLPAPFRGLLHISHLVLSPVVVVEILENMVRNMWQLLWKVYISETLSARKAFINNSNSIPSTQFWNINVRMGVWGEGMF